MAANLAAAFLGAVKSKMKVRRDEDLAARFGWAKSTVASWRSRGSIPDDNIKMLESFSGLEYQTFVHQFGQKQPIFDWLVELSFLHAFSAVCAGLTEHERRSFVIGVFWQVAALKKIIASRILARIGSLDIAEAYPEVFAEALRCTFLTPGEIRDSVSLSEPAPVPQKVPQ